MVWVVLLVLVLGLGVTAITLLLTGSDWGLPGLLMSSAGMIGGIGTLVLLSIGEKRKFKESRRTQGSGDDLSPGER